MVVADQVSDEGSTGYLFRQPLVRDADGAEFLLDERLGEGDRSGVAHVGRDFLVLLLFLLGSGAEVGVVGGERLLFRFRRVGQRVEERPGVASGQLAIFHRL